MERFWYGLRTERHALQLPWVNADPAEKLESRPAGKQTLKESRSRPHSTTERRTPKFSKRDENCSKEHADGRGQAFHGSCTVQSSRCCKACLTSTGGLFMARVGCMAVVSVKCKTDQPAVSAWRLPWLLCGWNTLALLVGGGRSQTCCTDALCLAINYKVNLTPLRPARPVTRACLMPCCACYGSQHTHRAVCRTTCCLQVQVGWQQRLCKCTKHFLRDSSQHAIDIR